MRKNQGWMWIVASGLALLPVSSFADIYSYTGSDGTMHFTNVPSGDNRYRLYMKGKDGKRGRGGAGARGGASVPPGDTSSERFSRYDDVIRQAATLYQIPEELVRAVIKVESDYDPRAVSRVGAQGLMQLMPETAERMQVRDIFDPRENILGGVRYLRVLANMFNGDLQLTIAGYNAGENAVVQHGGIPPYDETEDYVVEGAHLLPALPRQPRSHRSEPEAGRLARVAGRRAASGTSLGLEWLGGRAGGRRREACADLRFGMSERGRHHGVLLGGVGPALLHLGRELVERVEVEVMRAACTLGLV